MPSASFEQRRSKSGKKSKRTKSGKKKNFSSKQLAHQKFMKDWFAANPKKPGEDQRDRMRRAAAAYARR